MYNKHLIATFAISLLVACGGGGGSSSAPPAPVAVTEPEPDPITITGAVIDGPISGGTVFAFSAADITQVLTDASASEDRLASLQAAASVGSISRTDESDYSMEVSGDHAGSTVFLVFDPTGATDADFGDAGFLMESVLILGNAGDSVRANLTPHASLIAQQTRSSMADDGSNAASQIDVATSNIATAFVTDNLGRELLPNSTDIIGTEDIESLLTPSLHLGALIRTAAMFADITAERAVTAIAADTTDGQLDGEAGTSNFDETAIADVSSISPITSTNSLSSDLVGGSCSAAADVLALACEHDVIDDFLEGSGICQNTSDPDELSECLAEIEEEHAENVAECADVHTARLQLCSDLDDAPHIPEFGEDHVDNFVDPLMIGNGITPNPWIPLITGNTWVYTSTFEEEDEDTGDIELITETITVRVTNQIKVIDGVPCVTVNDVVEVDGNVIEDTDDWFAQDVNGNVWYCGEISENYETFEEDRPPLPELTDVEGSWKHGRDQAQAGILMPFIAVVEDVYRQEVLYGEAEDVVEIISLTGTESTPAASCTGTCLVTIDSTPLEPDVEEEKYYVEDLGLILEIDLEEDVRVELVSFTNG